MRVVSGRITLFLATLVVVVAASHLEAQTRKASINFYGKKLSFLKMFGQRHWGEAAAGPVTANNIYHAAGVVVDRHTVPHPIYVADTGNNRILGFRSYNSPHAELIFGQPDEFSSAANGDCNLGMLGTPTRTSLCLTAYPVATNFAEQWLRLHLDVDSQGNLYVPDFLNNRVLIYYAPFSDDTTGGKGDTIPDLVLGQRDYKSNRINQGQGPRKPTARSLHLSLGGFDHVSSRGISVDEQGNVWVADTFNFRVLRFPKGKTSANLVLGQSSFNSCHAEPDMEKATLGQMCTPTIARIDPETGELYVVDEHPRGFQARVLVFRPPFRNSMPAHHVFDVKQPLEGDYKSGYRLTHATGLVFNPVKTNDWIDPETKTHRYRDGLLWLCDQTRAMLLDRQGRILLAVGAPDNVTKGGRYDMYRRSGLDPLAPFNLIRPGGMIGFDSENNIYLADEAVKRVTRYALPYRTRKTEQGLAMPATNGGLFPETPVDSVHWKLDRVGVIPFRNQLIVRDHQRYMIWNDYLNKPDGAPADLFIGQERGDNRNQRNHLVDRSHHTIDHANRLWAGSEHGMLILYQLPFTKRAKPLRELIPLYWADEPNGEVVYRTGAVAFDLTNRVLWIYDNQHHRLLRVRNPDDWDGKLQVDMVIGQKDKLSGQLNRGMTKPDAASFGNANSIRFDRRGNLFVVDNNYEGHPNGRIIAFLAADLRKAKGMFPRIQAKRVYVVNRFDETRIIQIHDPVDSPFSPVSVAFSKNNEMVVGNDGYYRDPKLRIIRQLYLYRDPLKKTTPDAVIELPLGAPAEMHFDDEDNLIVMDHTWNKVWIINYHRDRAWLKPLN